MLQIINVATRVPSVPIKEQYKENQQQHERIKSIESSQR